MFNRLAKTCPFALFAVLLVTLGLTTTAFATTAKRTDVTRTLGPDFFIDRAAAGGKDISAKQPNKLIARIDFSEVKPLNVGAGGSTITITGIGFASPKRIAKQEVSELEISIRYLGQDGKGGNDDVVIGTTTAQFELTSAGEYAVKFDEPMTAVVDGKKPYFRVDIAPKSASGNGSLRFKADDDGAKISVAGFSKAVD